MKRKSVKEKTTTKGKMAFVLGITSTMPIVGVRFAGGYLELFDVSFILFLVLTFGSIAYKREYSIRFSSLKRINLLFLLWPIISYIVGIIYMPQEWHSSMTAYLIKIIEYIVLLIVIYVDDKKNIAELFAKGLIVGIIVNAIWAVLQAVTYYVFKKFLNTIIFVQILGLPRGGEIWNSFGGIRVSGLNYDPAHLGGLLPILFFYSLMKKKTLLFVLSLVSLAFSQSSTALVGYFVAFGIYLVVCIQKKKKSNIKLNSNKIIGVVFGIGVVAVVIIVLRSNKTFNSFVNGIVENIGGYISRINTVYVNSNRVEPRQVYYTRFFDGLIERGPLVSITGSGLGTSMYPFRNIGGLFAQGSQTKVTEIETNYIAYLFDLGIVGLFFYIVLLIRGFKKCWKIISKYHIDSVIVIYFGTFISIICCSTFYHYIFTAYQMLAFMFAAIYIDHIDDYSFKETCYEKSSVN